MLGFVYSFAYVVTTIIILKEVVIWSGGLADLWSYTHPSRVTLTKDNLTLGVIGISAYMHKYMQEVV